MLHDDMEDASWPERELSLEDVSEAALIILAALGTPMSSAGMDDDAEFEPLPFGCSAFFQV